MQRQRVALERRLLGAAAIEEWTRRSAALTDALGNAILGVCRLSTVVQVIAIEIREARRPSERHAEIAECVIARARR